MSNRNKTIFCTPAFGLFGSVIDLGVDLAPVRDRIKACKLRYHKELWDIICDRGIQGNDGGSGEQAAEGGGEGANQSNTSRGGVSGSNSALQTGDKTGRSDGWRSRNGISNNGSNKHFEVSPRTSSPSSTPPIAAALLSEQSQLLQQQQQQQQQPFLQNQNQWMPQQQQRQPQQLVNLQQNIPQFLQAMHNQPWSYFEDPTMQSQWLPNPKQQKRLHTRHKSQRQHLQFEPQPLYLEKQQRRHHVSRQLHPKIEEQIFAPMQSYQDFQKPGPIPVQEYLDIKKPGLIPMQQYPDVKNQAPITLQQYPDLHKQGRIPMQQYPDVQNQAPITLQQYPDVQKQVPIPMQQYPDVEQKRKFQLLQYPQSDSQNNHQIQQQQQHLMHVDPQRNLQQLQQQLLLDKPLELDTQPSHPVNPRLAYFSRSKTRLLDCDFSTTASSSCYSTSSTGDEPEKLPAPARHYLASHTFVPMKCGDWVKSDATTDKKKRHKHSKKE